MPGCTASRRARTARNAPCRTYWAEHAEAWLQGFDGVPLGSELRPVTEALEAELDERSVVRED